MKSISGLKFAAIDIGSNAVRLLFSLVYEIDSLPQFRKISLIRIPLRLGEDAFMQKMISPEKTEALIKTMIAFKYLLEVNNPHSYMACATSAMREAQNSKEILKEIKNQTNIDVQIISGEKEATIIYSNHIAESLNPKTSYLYLDVGGGSTDFTLFANNKVMASNSFDIGCIRILEDLVIEPEWERLRLWLDEELRNYHPVAAIGTGGNINTAFKLSGKKEGKPLTVKNIKNIYENLKHYSYEERVKKLGLKPDRADVIIPALEIYLSIMKWGKMSEMYVPIIGLLDGIIHLLYEQYKERNTTIREE